MHKFATGMVVLLLAVSVGAAQSRQDYEQTLEDLVPYTKMRLEHPYLTLGDYDTAVKQLAEQLAAGQNRAAAYSYSPAIPTYAKPRTTYVNPYEQTNPYGVRTTGTSTDLGGTAYLNIYGSDGNSVSGTSMQLGNTTYTNLYGAGGSVSGTSQQMGDITFHNLYGTGGSTQGTSLQIGSFTYHNLYNSDGNSLNGTSMQIGDFTFHNLNGSDGSTASGTSIQIGNMTFTNMYGTGGDGD